MGQREILQILPDSEQEAIDIDEICRRLENTRGSSSINNVWAHLAKLSSNKDVCRKLRPRGKGNGGGSGKFIYWKYNVYRCAGCNKEFEPITRSSRFKFCKACAALNEIQIRNKLPKEAKKHFQDHSECYFKEARAILTGKHWENKNKCTNLEGD